MAAFVSGEGRRPHFVVRPHSGNMYFEYSLPGAGAHFSAERIAAADGALPFGLMVLAFTSADAPH